MRTFVLLLVAVVVIIALLVATGFLNLSPEGEAALEGARDNVGGAIEDTGQAIQGEAPVE